MTDQTERSRAYGLHREDPIPATTLALQPAEPADDGVRRITLEQVALASWHLRRLGEGDVHVHEARKATKRARAVLRLVRDAIGEDAYREANVTLRDVAGDISELRSATVRVETIDMLAEGQEDLVESVVGLRREFVADAMMMRASVARDPRRAESLVMQIERVRAGVGGWMHSPTTAPMARGLRRTYRRGRREMARAYRDESVGAFHRWRKQAKYLRYQMEVITRSNPAEIPALVVSLEEIGAGLGTDHDLADLLSTVTGSGEVFASRIGLDGLIDAIAHRRTVIESEVRPIAERVYAQLPHEFCDRMMLGI